MFFIILHDYEWLKKSYELFILNPLPTWVFLYCFGSFLFVHVSYLVRRLVSANGIWHWFWGGYSSEGKVVVLMNLLKVLLTLCFMFLHHTSSEWIGLSCLSKSFLNFCWTDRYSNLNAPTFMYQHTLFAWDNCNNLNNLDIIEKCRTQIFANTILA